MGKVEVDTFTLDEESELTEQLDFCAGSQTSQAQEKRRLSNIQVEDVNVECQEPFNAINCVKAAASRGLNGIWNPYSHNKQGEKRSHSFIRQAACRMQVMTHAFKEKE